MHPALLGHGLDTPETPPFTHKTASSLLLSPDGPPLATKQFHRTMLVGSPQLPGADTANYNPLQMRGPNAKIFKGTCKWYNSQRGFGFIIPVCEFFLMVH